MPSETLTMKGAMELEREAQVERVKLQREAARKVVEHFRKGLECTRMGDTMLTRYLIDTFPMPLVSRPLRVRLSGGEIVAYAYDTGRFTVLAVPPTSRRSPYQALSVEIVAQEFIHTPLDLRLLARCVDGEREEVREEEEEDAV